MFTADYGTMVLASEESFQLFAPQLDLHNNKSPLECCLFSTA